MIGVMLALMAAWAAGSEPSQPGSVQLTVGRTHSADDVMITVSAAPDGWWASSVRPDGETVLTNSTACPGLVTALEALANQPPMQIYLRGISPIEDSGGPPPYHAPIYSISGVYAGDGAFGTLNIGPINGPLNTWARDFVDTISRCAGASTTQG